MPEQNKEIEILLPAGLFLFLLKELKIVCSIDNIEENYFKEIMEDVFGVRYINDNWRVGKQALLDVKMIESNTWLEKDIFRCFIKITNKGIAFNECKRPADWCEEGIKRAVENLKFK